MGNVNMFKNNDRNFIEQIKVDAAGKSKILGIYINQNEFPKSGLIIVSTKGKVIVIFIISLYISFILKQV